MLYYYNYYPPFVLPNENFLAIRDMQSIPQWANTSYLPRVAIIKKKLLTRIWENGRKYEYPLYCTFGHNLVQLKQENSLAIS